jgi:hypothetical protein
MENSKYREILLDHFAGSDATFWNDIAVINFIGKSEADVFIVEGMNILRELVQISRENDWLNDFVPSFELCLKDSEKIERDPSRTLFKDTKSLIRNLDIGLSPEICMEKKIQYTIEDPRAEEHTYIYPSSSDLFHRIFGPTNSASEKNFYIKYVCVKSIDVYLRYIDVVYNENNSEVVRDVKRLKLKDKASIELVKKLREEERQKTAEEE